MSGSIPISTRIFTNKLHATHISNKLQAFYVEKKFCNIALVAGIDDVRVEAHRIVLCAGSGYFEELLGSYPENDKIEQIKVENIDGATLKTVLNYVYTDRVELRSDTIVIVLSAAAYFQMNALVAACCDFMEKQLNPGNCLVFAFIAKEYGYTELHEKSLAFAYGHCEEVCTQEEFLQLDEGQLNDFLSGDDLRVASQEKLFHNLVAWYQYDAGNREKLICSRLLRHVRFELLEQKFILENAKKISNIAECLQLMWSWIERHSLKILFTYTDGVKLSFQTFSAESNAWSYEHWPSLSEERVLYSALVIDKKLVIAGGQIKGKQTNKVEYLDLESMQWISLSLPSMLEKRDLPSMAEVNGELYVVGGFGGRLFTIGGKI